jgi:hypothetical protein
VQAYFAESGKNFMTHATRTNAILNGPRISSVYDDYRELETISREARYDCTTFSNGHVKYAQDRLEVVRSAITSILGV